ncbi:MAG: ankyrin repeat domain-containing protein [Bacteroidota bacterium]
MTTDRIKSYIFVKNRLTGLLAVLILSGCGGHNENKTGQKEEVNSAQVQPAGQINVSVQKAALDGDIISIKQILSGGTDADNTDEDGRTALMYASFNGHTEVVRFLIGKGAAVNLADPNMRTPLMFASSGPFPETVKLLLEHNADPNLTDLPEHFTALMYAAAEGHLENVRILLANNADPSLKDADGDDALTFALKNGHKDVADLIRSFTGKPASES